MKRILVDVDTDFVFAPQYKLLYEFMQDELVNALRSGNYQASPLITAEVPKPSGLTRPGSILFPLDRVLNQALADQLATLVDPQLNEQRVFSYRLMDPDPDGQMFAPRNVAYSAFETAVAAKAAKAIVEARDRQGSFISIGEFMERTGLVREALENMADAGAFDSLAEDRRSVKWEIGLGTVQ